MADCDKFLDFGPKFPRQLVKKKKKLFKKWGGTGMEITSSNMKCNEI